MKVSIVKMSAMALGVLVYSQAQAQPPQRPDKEEVFAKLDTSKDGQLDKEEFKAGAKMRKEKISEKKDARKAFDRMDADKNGTIEFDEFEKAGEARQERREERLTPDELFEKIDTNADGFVSLEEFKSHKRPDKNKN
ncbi:MAG: EF-hand domain-containing protein [Reichenbachiella sp.]|uniref:EF-hand domain-containing protein n=1 Tax=Reichenbachiella sp. TaxID=2184521 RepID=UPI002965F253|nr:EF-hand domain-containing protein [Reichenbachiella sp.]MDW3209957.1 EF-hand domain-containing protein [Reichenbachiella sp.]